MAAEDTMQASKGRKQLRVLQSYDPYQQQPGPTLHNKLKGAVVVLVVTTSSLVDVKYHSRIGKSCLVMGT